jgi:hypothetical protein
MPAGSASESQSDVTVGADDVRRTTLPRTSSRQCALRFGRGISAEAGGDRPGLLDGGRPRNLIRDAAERVPGQQVPATDQQREGHERRQEEIEDEPRCPRPHR